MFFPMLCNFWWDWNHKTSIVVAKPNALCETHFEKIRTTSENKIIAIQISTTMFNSQLALTLQVHINKSGKYPNSCKLFHLHILIHTMFCKLCTLCMFYTCNLYLYFAKYWFHDWRCGREIWGRKFELKWEKCFKCMFIFSFDIKWELENLEREGVWKMPPWHFFFKWLGNNYYIQRLKKLGNGEKTCKQDFKKVENKIKA